ncbi:MAG: hypothetical protein KatS3mg103_0805 [Phycisphaerales bacterium]|nr:MAG: hypothetical protein KatS3mg103_0805 [Phycisphaerales bacterium]
MGGEFAPRHTGSARRPRPRAGRGFTIIDVLVSVAVIMVLISLMLPALTKATETAHRVICSSNVRQIGIGVLMYADANQDQIPPTTFYDPRQNRAEQMLILRLSGVSSAPRDFDPKTNGWDGLGLLYHEQYLDHSACYYCPSHSGAHPYSEYASSFGEVPAVVVGNYQYRGAGPKGQRHLSKIEPRRTALIADGMRLRSDYNHKVGSNVMRADLSVTWFRDYGGRILARLPEEEAEARSSIVLAAWELIDSQLDGSAAGGDGPSDRN